MPQPPRQSLASLGAGYLTVRGGDDDDGDAVAASAAERPKAAFLHGEISRGEAQRVITAGGGYDGTFLVRKN